MKKNLGKIDRIIRFILSLILIYLGYFILPNYGIVFSMVSYILAIALIFNALSGYCGLYRLLGINTNKTCDLEKNKKDNKEN
ncbi:MAG: DUF2892 domain-containing protein [Candidatus Pacebacteria bacterium]|nr:DUF2892 domain-containing protein [Candidatus Paceibacterota bacterium]